MAQPKSIALFGATGLVGNHCLRLLLEDNSFARVVTFTRRPLPATASGITGHPGLEAHTLDLGQIQRHAQALAVDQVICALGTTLRKAGSQQEFRKVDHDYPLAIARVALAQGAHHFLLVSAIGANPGSRFFYNRVKGEVEAAILAFPFRSHTIARPSLLLGKRDEFRFGEKIAQQFAFLMPERYKPVSALAVAQTLVAAARDDRAGIQIIESVTLIPEC